jgi:hypothetical protein
MGIGDRFPNQYHIWAADPDRIQRSRIGFSPIRRERANYRSKAPSGYPKLNGSRKVQLRMVEAGGNRTPHRRYDPKSYTVL